MPESLGCKTFFAVEYSRELVLLDMLARELFRCLVNEEVGREDWCARWGVRRVDDAVLIAQVVAERR